MYLSDEEADNINIQNKLLEIIFNSDNEYHRASAIKKVNVNNPILKNLAISDNSYFIRRRLQKNSRSKVAGGNFDE